MNRLIAVLAAGIVSGALMADEPVAANMPYPSVEIVTSHGRMVFQLDRPRAPLTVDNFIRYVLDRHYDDTLFHRVMAGFVIQGGGYLEDFSERTTRESIVNESGNGLSNERGTLAMARHEEPHTGTAQWYINVANNERLDPTPRRWGYAVFGRLTEGEEVMDRIAALETGEVGPFTENAPLERVIIQHIRLIEE